MFCPNCGSENEANARVCVKCGTPLGVTTPTKKPTMSKKTMGILVGGLVAVIALVFMLINSMNTINLNKYLVFEQSGVNGYGKVSIYFDEEKFVEDNGDKFKLSKEGKKQLSKDFGFDASELAEYLEEYTGEYLADSFISYGADIDYERASNYSNGDKVEYTIELDEETLDYLDCKIKYKNGTYKFDGLEEPKTTNYFDYVTVTFEGVSPNGGYVNVEEHNMPNALSEIYIDSIENNGSLSNGDVVTININESSIESNIKHNGYVPSMVSKEFTVSGLREKVTKVDQIDPEGLEYMLNEAEDYMTAYAAKKWNPDTEELVSLEHTGTWVVSPKKNANSSNFIYLTFDATVHMTDEEYDYDNTATYVWYICFVDTYLIDGKMDFESSSIRTADYYSDYVNYCKDGSSSCWYDRFYYYGYKDTDAFTRARINIMLDNYEVDGGLLG